MALPWGGGDLLVACGHFILIRIYPDGMYTQVSVGGSGELKARRQTRHAFFIIEERVVMEGGEQRLWRDDRRDLERK